MPEPGRNSGTGTQLTRAIAVGALAVHLFYAGEIGACLAQTPESDTVLMLADEIIVDDRRDTVTARGSVEISRGGRILLADTVLYDKSADLVTASGNVSILEPSGHVVFADSAQLTGDLKNGAVERLAILLSDQSRMAAARGRLTGGNLAEFTKVTYSPCNLCNEHPTRAPLWQINAYRVLHDKQKREMSYKDAFLEIYGIPVFYLPFFKHPDPTVERKSGFLPPKFGVTSALGFTYEQPYYFNVSPHKDATFAPIATTKEGLVLAGQYREATETGYYEINGSITNGSITDADSAHDTNTYSKRVRAHIDAFGEFALNPYWDYGFKVQRSTDQTYLARYGFERDRATLIQNAYMRGGDDRDFVNIDAIYFQNLNASIREGGVPLVLPLIEYGYRSKPGVAGSVWSLHADGRVLQRTEGRDSGRASAALRWELPLLGHFGEVMQLRLSTRIDGYHANDFIDPENPDGPAQDGVSSRVVPQLEFNWRWPWGRTGDASQQVIEPIVQVVAAPNGGNPKAIPNDDSLAFEFNDTNLFDANKHPGRDRIESGFRLNYGVRVAHQTDSGKRSDLLFGQSYRARSDDALDAESGYSANWSDFVGRLRVSLAPYFDMGLRVRLDRKTLGAQRLSLDTGFGPAWLRGGLSYTALRGLPTADGPSSAKQIAINAAYRFAENWSISARHRQFVGGGDNKLASGIGLEYEDECTLLNLSINRNFTTDRDIIDTTNVLLEVKLRNVVQ